MGLGIKRSPLERKLEDKDFQKKAISKVESMKPAMKYGGKMKMKKAENGKSFPDLNKDGKITKADILKGRGVIAKSGKSMMSKGGMMKRGGMMKKGC